MKEKKRWKDYQINYCIVINDNEMQGCVGCQNKIIAQNQGRKLNRY